MKKIKEKGITLIALIITIILMLILVGVVLNLTLGKNGIFNTAKYAVVKNSEETAREKLEVALADLQARKYTDATYNENEYIDNYLIKEEITVSENIAFVDGWKFELDRTVPKIGQNLGKGKLESIAIITPYIGTTSFTTKISYVYNEEEIESYTYKIDNIESKTIIEKEYTTENELEAESTYTVQVIAKYKNGKTIESNIVTIKTEPRTYLYNNGDECVNITGGWKAEAIGCGNSAVLRKPTLNAKVDGNHMNIYILPEKVSTYSVGGSVMPMNKVDYSKYKKICINYNASLGMYEAADIIQVWRENNDNKKICMASICYNSAITNAVIKLDIPKTENINDIFLYLQIHQNSSKVNCDIYEIWLEK